MQAKRIQEAHADLVGLTQLSVALTPPVIPREEINYHNIWASLSVEPEDASANSHGVWILFVNPVGASIPTWDLVTMNAESFNAIIIACGTFGASNETPYNKEIHPTTSRTLQAGEQLVLSVNIHGVTAGENSTDLLLCAHTTRK